MLNEPRSTRPVRYVVWEANLIGEKPDEAVYSIVHSFLSLATKTVNFFVG